MSRSGLLGLVLAVAVAVPALAPAGGAGNGGLPAAEAATAKARAFRSCAGLVRYARRHALKELIPDFGYAEEGGGRPQQAEPLAGPDGGFSQTNVQEAGVDEPDLVKTDGARIFALARGALHAIEAGGPRRLGSLRLGGGSELLLYGDRALVFSVSAAELSARASTVPDAGPTRAKIWEIDVSDPARMRVVRSMELDGGYVGARLIGATARVVLSSSPRAIDSAYVHVERRRVAGRTEAELRARWRSSIRRSRARDWLPSGVLRDRRTGRKRRYRPLACRSARRPPTFSGLGMLTVLTIDLRRGLPAIDADALMTDGQTAYSSPSGMYVATERWLDPESNESPRAGRHTAIHKFDVSRPGSTEYRASGAVRGFLLNQFALSEHEGLLRAATTDTSPEDAEEEGRRQTSESFVTVLAERGARLERVGRVRDLGHGERIYAVRFIGDRGYVVTFREVDPLYAIDLATPTRPRVVGELKIRGYSAYLHPVGADLLLGVGQDADRRGATRGVQLSLFDVSDPRRPRRLHQRVLPYGSSSEVEYDHHAFLHWPPTGLAVVPFEVSGGRRDLTGAVGFGIDRTTGIRRIGRVSHRGGYDAAIRRSLVIDERLFTLSDHALVASDLYTFARRGSLRFPR